MTQQFGYLSQKNEDYVHTKTCTRVFIAVVLVTAKKTGNNPEVPQGVNR